MGARRTVCTIVARNYLAHARTLSDSLREQHPELRLQVLVIDLPDEDQSLVAEPFGVWCIGALTIPHVREFCFKYDVTEFATAVKPYFLSLLLKNHEQVIYLDPDILVLHRLDGIFDRLDTADMVFTPHLDTDKEDAGLFLTVRQVMLTGIFNLGFLAVNCSTNALRFLGWWETKLSEHCLNDQSCGVFVDQKFVDVALTLFENWHIERNRGYNAAPWNLHSREVSRDDRSGEWLCNGAPLYFFHFSSFKPIDASKPASWNFPAEARTGPLRELYEIYGTYLHQNDFMASRKVAYGYATFASGRRIAEETRKLYHASDWLRPNLGDPFQSRALQTIQPIIVRLIGLRRKNDQLFDQLVLGVAVWTNRCCRVWKAARCGPRAFFAELKRCLSRLGFSN
jgi:lipopolysaccharide biosynthesis glycosyltransferase